MKSLVILLLLLLSSVCFAEDNICFSESTAKVMIIELEKSNNYKERFELCESGRNELEYQIRLLKEIQILKNEQLELYKQLVTTQKTMYESIIKESKPSFVQEFFKFIGTLGIGVAIGAIAFGL